MLPGNGASVLASSCYQQDSSIHLLERNIPGTGAARPAEINERASIAAALSASLKPIYQQKRTRQKRINKAHHQMRTGKSAQKWHYHKHIIKEEEQGVKAKGVKAHHQKRILRVRKGLHQLEGASGEAYIASRM